MKIVKTKCRKDILAKYSKQLNRMPALGYESCLDYAYGYISALRINKLINNVEFKWLGRVYINHPVTDDGLASRYAINGKGEIEDYNDDALKEG